MYMFVCVFFLIWNFFAKRPAMVGLMGFSGSLLLRVTVIDIIICVFINWANKDACLLAC